MQVATRTRDLAETMTMAATLDPLTITTMVAMLAGAVVALPTKVVMTGAAVSLKLQAGEKER